MRHQTAVPWPVWCPHCELTTESTFMISGEGDDVTLQHYTCGKVLARLTLRDLREMRDIQLSTVAQELVNRANRLRPVTPKEDEGAEAFRLASFGLNPRYWGDIR